MVAEFGLFLLILGFLIASFQGLLIFAPWQNRVDPPANWALAIRCARAQLITIAGAFICLTYLHAASDFSVANVVENSHSAKPFIYKLTGVWGNHEGSMLLWILILAGYGFAISFGKRTALQSGALRIQGLVASAFLAFSLFTSNPFARVFPIPADGRGLNPLLQDPGLAIHPPFLYAGYVGLSITFAFAVAGLLQGRIDADWARAVRPWTLAAWVALTIGIALGSWWAYYELGWGGFWAWDPVENASFMPWLAATAFLHSVRVVEKRDALKVWTALLAILGFSLSLVGAFLVRSGIITSVHAFAVDPERGVFILAILGAAVGGSLAVFAWKAPKLTTTASFDPVSREGAILINNVFLSTACATVFVGTFYALFIDVASGERLSVQSPYFNATFLPLMALMLLVMGPGAMISWKRGRLKPALRRLIPVAAFAFVVGTIAAAFYWPKPIAAGVGIALGLWAGGGALLDFAHRIRAFSAPRAEMARRFATLPRPYLGMTLAHIGVTVLVIGVMGAGVWRHDVVALVEPSDSITVGGFTATLNEVERGRGPNYIYDRALFDISRDDRTLRALSAERRFYPIRQMTTTEAGIWTMAFGDLYLTLGEPTDGAWAVRAWYNPFALWLWIGSGLIAGGGIVAMTRTRRSPKTTAQEQSAPNNLVSSPESVPA